MDKQRERMIALIEGPALFPNLSAYDTLNYYCLLWGIKDKSQINTLLTRVGLANTGNKQFKNFSLGMKQRLGIAISLLNNPDFIVLDEPINGLDPVGIVEVRNLIKELSEKDGITILISSHILNELAQVATRFGIVNKGTLIKKFTSEELEADSKKSLVITVDNIQKTTNIIDSLGIDDYKIEENQVTLYSNIEDSAKINSTLVSAGVMVSQLSLAGNNLEEFFISLVGEVE